MSIEILEKGKKKEKKRKEKYPLFIFRISVERIRVSRAVETIRFEFQFDSLFFFPTLRTRSFSKLISIKRSRRIETPPPIEGRNIKAGQIRHFSNSGLNNYLCTCVRACVRVSLYLCVVIETGYKDEKTGSGRAPVRLWVGVRSMSGPFV